jgi:hypothetical protein
MRILTVAESEGRAHYPTTLFKPAEAQAGSCTARGTIYTATIAAGLMLHQLARWLRQQPGEADLMLNLLAAELVTHQRAAAAPIGAGSEKSPARLAP